MTKQARKNMVGLAVTIDERNRIYIAAQQLQTSVSDLLYQILKKHTKGFTRWDTIDPTTLKSFRRIIEENDENTPTISDHSD